MALNNGPAEGTPALFLSQTVGLETSLPNGTPSLSPAFAPYIDPNTSYQGTVVNKLVAGNIQVTIPA